MFLVQKMVFLGIPWQSNGSDSAFTAEGAGSVTGLKN